MAEKHLKKSKDSPYLLLASIQRDTLLHVGLCTETPEQVATSHPQTDPPEGHSSLFASGCPCRQLWTNPCNFPTIDSEWCVTHDIILKVTGSLIHLKFSPQRVAIVFQIHSVILRYFVSQVRQKGDFHLSQTSLFSCGVDPANNCECFQMCGQNKDA